MSIILVTGATGKHGGTGTIVARRLKQEGHSVRILVRVRDKRSEALETEGFDVRLGDLRDRNSLLPVMEGIEQATFCFPIDAGIVEAAASFSSALHKVSPNARVIVMSMGVAQEFGPSALGRAAWLAEEVIASYNLNPSVLRIAALFYENILLLHGESIRERGLIRNCFGDTQIPWIAGIDAAELIVSALLNPERVGAQSVSYPPGVEMLSHAQVAEILSAELGRPVRYEAISMEEWRNDLLSISERGHPVINRNMAHHISSVGAALAQKGGSQKAPASLELANQLGRSVTSFQDFVRTHRSELTR